MRVARWGAAVCLDCRDDFRGECDTCHEARNELNRRRQDARREAYKTWRAIHKRLNRLAAERRRQKGGLT